MTDRPHSHKESLLEKHSPGGDWGDDTMRRGESLRLDLRRLPEFISSQYYSGKDKTDINKNILIYQLKRNKIQVRVLTPRVKESVEELGHQEFGLVYP